MKVIELKGSIDSAFKHMSKDIQKDMTKAMISTVNRTAGNTRIVAQKNIARKFTNRNNFTRDSVLYTQCGNVSKIEDIVAVTGITDRAYYMRRQETGGTKKTSDGEGLKIPFTETARRGSNKNKVTSGLYWSKIRTRVIARENGKQTRFFHSHKANLVAMAAAAFKSKGFIQIKNIVSRVVGFKKKSSLKSGLLFKTVPVYNKQHDEVQVKKEEWLEPAALASASHMQRIFNEEMDKL